MDGMDKGIKTELATVVLLVRDVSSRYDLAICEIS